MSKRVLSAAGRDNLSPALRFTMKTFEARSFYWYDPPIELPPSTPTADKTYDPKQDALRYASFCQDMLDNGKVSAGMAKSMLVGLKGCGKLGEEISAKLKKKILKR
jgi:hypothetical protein